MFAKNKIAVALPLITVITFSTLTTLLATPQTALAQNAPTASSILPTSSNLQKTVGNYEITLRLPKDGVFAREQIDIEFRFADTRKIDSISGAVGVARVQTKATITMPEMAGMPAQNPKIHSEGIPGEYGLECFFPHGGQYEVALSLLPPGESKPVTTQFLVDVQDAETKQNKKPTPQPYFVEVKNLNVAKAGVPTDLQLVIRETQSKAIVKDFDIAHTKIFHLILASKDLSWFAHEHPVPQADGSFTISQVFPSGGEYKIYADVAPKGAGSQILGTSLKVSGPTPKPITLTLSERTNTVNGVTATLKTATPLPIGKSTALTFALTDSITGKMITDLEPYLGAFGHLMIIHQNGQTVVHSHPAEDEAGRTDAKKGIVAFNARFPKAGLYKAWGQFQRNSQVVTIPFVLKIGGNN